MKIKRFVVRKGDHGLKLQTFVRQQLGSEWSTRKVKGLIDRNRCRLNGEIERYGCTPLVKGDEIEFLLDEQAVQSRIVFEDDHLVVYAKAPGVTFEKICDHIAVHRLDRDTSGLIVFAKSDEAAGGMENLFRRRKVRKRYLALVDGVPKEERGTQTAPVNGSPAETFWQRAKKGKQASLIKCYPETGRTHQIRVHLSAMGHPILGDGEYCRRFSCEYPVPRHMLHAEQLIFAHPITGKKIVLEERPPADFRQAARALV